MDERRILIPSEIRMKLRLKPGTELDLKTEKGMLVLKTITPKPVQVQSRKQNWGRETFLDAGEATFGD